MNRVAHLLRQDAPEPVGPFSDSEALTLLMAYRKDPSNVPCPTCGPELIEVLAFIEPEIDRDGFATARQPEGDYAATVYCHRCKRAIGLLVGVTYHD